MFRQKERRGIGVKGNFFNLIFSDSDEYMLEMCENCDKFCVEVESYVTNLEKPCFTSGLIIN